MCGYIGKISFNNIDHNQLKIANDLMICRGPDNTSSYIEKFNDINYSLLFNRLKIVDLSDSANQPMLTEDSNYLVMFNGEIFNHLELRDELIKFGAKFITKNSDTEVVLNGFKYFGKNFVQKLRGQFSICFIDKNKNKVYLVSDRLNQKPLYYFFQNKTLTFSSNLRSLLKSLKHYSFDEKYINEYLMYGIVSSPNTIFKNIFKMKPGQIIEVEINSDKFNMFKNIYWDPKDYINNNKFSKDQFFEFFEESIQIRKNADVPIANFLSGGIDSTSIIKSLSEKNEDINSFSVVFNEEKYNEQKWSRLVAKKYKTNHVEINASIDLGIDQISKALYSLDEPYSDPSVVPSYLISEKISQHYKVAISGDGGDELLGGYERTNIALKNKSFISDLISKMYRFYPGILGSGNFFLSKSKNLNLMYESFFKDEKFFNLLNVENTHSNQIICLEEGLDKFKSLLLQDYQYYLPEMMMFKIDRTSMQNSLEVRSPFVDHKLVEYVLSTSLDVNSLNMNKNILKNYLLKDFGIEFTTRRKKGFVFDLESWVFSNLPHITDIINNGIYSHIIPKNLISKLSINKSRINANRIWKIFVLENYLSSID